MFAAFDTPNNLPFIPISFALGGTASILIIAYTHLYNIDRRLFSHKKPANCDI